VKAEPALKRLAERLCEDSVAAHDLLPDTFERAVRQGIQPEVRNTGGGSTRPMHNLFMDRCRAAARQPNFGGSRRRTEQRHAARADATEPEWNRITAQDISRCA